MKVLSIIFGVGQIRSAMIAAMLFIAVSPALAGVLTEGQMCEIIRRDIAEYHATGHPCPCPYSLMRNNAACGNRAAWAKPEGKAPRCYFEDVEGSLPPNRAPNPIRQRWPDPPPCVPTS